MGIMWHVQHIMGIFSGMSSVIKGIVLMDLKYVLRSHTTERFLLLYGPAFLFQHVRFEIQGYGVGFQLEGNDIIGFQQDIMGHSFRILSLSVGINDL